MLHTETVTAETYVLMQELMQKDYLSDFYLVGGTALALQIGHRTSTDIDLFNHIEFDKVQLSQRLENDYSGLEMNINFFGIFAYINEIKTDIVYHPFPLLSPVKTIDGIRMLDKSEIAPMKIHAITKRAKKRDFVDLFKLLDYFTLNEMLEFYSQKFGPNGSSYVIRSLVYFDEAEDDNVPKCFFEFDWNKVKNRIVHEVKKL